MSEGHVDARYYPIGMVWDEVALVVDRLNRAYATEALLTQLAVSSILSSKAKREFDKQIKRLNGGG